MRGGVKNAKNAVKLVTFALACALGLVAIAVLARAIFSGGVATFFTFVAPHFQLLGAAP